MKHVLVVHPERAVFDLFERDELKLYELQEWVGGYIEVAPMVELEAKQIAMLVNEEGLLAGLDLNENLLPFFYVGSCVFVGVDGEDFVGLSDDQLEFVVEFLDKLTK